VETAWSLVLNSILLGFGLAMDAFSVSLADGLQEPDMPRGRIAAIAGTFAGFQALMPMIGWVCVRTILEIFRFLQTLIPWAAFALLMILGARMILEGLGKKEEEEVQKIGGKGLAMQGIATSIDALSVGFAMAELDGWHAAAQAGIIGAVTFVICAAGILMGKKAGTKLAGKAGIIGGAVLMAVGIRILISHLAGG
jgi:putative Mn2+ efflux pump MntP